MSEGPQEQHDQWRSLRTHSMYNLMTTYKEIFFAGFPQRLKENRTSPDDTLDEKSGWFLDASVRTFPQSFVYDFFQRFGAIEHFIYDENRGAGSVTFSDGELAETCYLTAHLSLVYPPTSIGDDDEAAVRATKKAEPLKPILVFLEFAQALAFVNTGLLLHDELQPAEMSRHLMRTFPRVERKFSSTTADHVVMQWVKDVPTEVEELTGVQAILRPVGPSFPGGDVGVPELLQSVWKAVRPRKLKPDVALTVTVIDLWYEYYDLFQVHKTTPEASRITSPFYRFAQRQSVVQEILALDPSDPHESGSGPNAAHMLIHSEAYHQIATLLCYKIKFKNDPSWVSFMRDVFTESVVAAVTKAMESRTYMSERHLMFLQKSILQSMTHNNEKSEEEWLKIPLTEAVFNAMKNVVFLRRVDMGEIDRKTGKDLPADMIRAIRAKNKMDASALSDGYIVYSDFASYVDSNAATGSASTLLTICEDPKVFRETENHVGHSAVFEHYSTWRVLWDIFWVPLLVIAFFIAVIVGTSVFM